jgi:secreted trypsin-like serine protease
MRAHPQYNDQTLDNDIGVALLAQPVTQVQPHPINTTAIAQSYKGQPIRLVGFGITAANQQTPLTTKRTVTTTLNGIESTSLFIGGAGKQACNGDSGGPAFLNMGGKELLVAVTSGGPEDCNQGGYHTRVDAFMQFLAPYLAPASPPPPGPSPPSGGGTGGGTGTGGGGSGGGGGGTGGGGGGTGGDDDDWGPPVGGGAGPGGGTGGGPTKPATSGSTQYTQGGCSVGGVGAGGIAPLSLLYLLRALLWRRRSSRNAAAVKSR